jgi:hypothetical protein
MSIQLTGICLFGRPTARCSASNSISQANPSAIHTKVRAAGKASFSLADYHKRPDSADSIKKVWAWWVFGVEISMDLSSGIFLL